MIGTGSRTTLVVIALALGLGPWAGLAPFGDARADEVEVHHRLPTARDAMAAATDGEGVFLFGGYDGAYLRQIVKYDPSGNVAEVLTSQLPTARIWPTAVHGAGAYYVIGGHDGAHLRDILRFDPDTGEVTTMTAKLPSGRSYAASVWTGSHVLIFGGSNGASPNGYLRDIYRYDPMTDNLTAMTAKLPTGRDLMGVAWDGQAAYLFGGGSAVGVLRDILRYDPASDTIATLAAKLPEGRAAASVAWSGTRAFIFDGVGAGGAGGAGPDSILQFDPAAGEVYVMGAKFSPQRGKTAAAWAEGAAFIFGGRTLNGEGSYLDEIVRYDPFRPGTPGQFSAAGGPDFGEVTLTWNRPGAPDDVDSYRIYRGTEPGNLSLHAEVAGTVTNLTDRGLAQGSTFRYAVSAVNAHGESRRTTELCASPPPTSILPSVGKPCSLPAGWTERIVFRHSQRVSVPPLGPVVVDGGPSEDPRYYRLDASIGDAEIPTLEVLTEGAVALPLHIEVPLPLVGTDRVDVAVAYRFDSRERTCLAFAEHVCAGSLPFNPLDVTWAMGPGANSEVAVTLTTYPTGGEPQHHVVRIPLVGQAGAALPG